MHKQFNLLYQFWIHTEVRNYGLVVYDILYYSSLCPLQVVDQLGPLEWVLNTPSHHRVHHGRLEQGEGPARGGVSQGWANQGEGTARGGVSQGRGQPGEGSARGRASQGEGSARGRGQPGRGQPGGGGSRGERSL